MKAPDEERIDVVSARTPRGRRILGKIRRGRFASPPDEAALVVRPEAGTAVKVRPEIPRAREGGEASWDHTARPSVSAPPTEELSLRARILSLFADPRVDAITLESAARSLAAPRQDIETTLDAMVQAGELVDHSVGSARGEWAVGSPRAERADATAGSPRAEWSGTRQYRVPLAEKQRLESMFRDAAHELGEQGVLVHVGSDADGALANVDEETEEPRLPVTAGLLSLFLPGTGQLLNGDVGRASLVFAVWSLAWITHLSPVWTFVCLYAGAEAFFTAKIRSMERKLAKEALAGGRTPPQLPPPKPSQT